MAALERMSLRGVAVGLALGLGVAGGLSCTTASKRDAAKSALDAMPREQRLDTFEGTCEALDERPDLVDELYTAARRHRPLLDRFMMNAARDLREPAFAELTAKHLVDNPASVEQVLATTLDFIYRRPEARAAMNRAMSSRAEEATEIITGDAATVSRFVQAGLLVLEKKPQARRAALTATEKNRARILAFIKEDPGLAKELGEQVLREAVKDKPELEKALRAAKVIDDKTTR